MADVTIRHSSATAGREIKASAHYAYITTGITLDGSKFAVNELVLEGTCLVKDDTSGMYEKYADTVVETVHSFPAGKSNPVIIDESIKFQADDAGANPNVTAGQVMVHGAVYNGMLIGATATFKTALQGFIRFV